MKFVEKPRHYLLISLGIGCLIAFFMVFTEPFDTQRQADLSTSLKLMGYGAVVFISLLLSYVVERKWYLKSSRVWHWQNEAFSMAMLFLVIAVLTNIYHAMMFGAPDKTLVESGLFIIKFVMPFAVFVFPVIVLLRQHVGTQFDATGHAQVADNNLENVVRIEGENADERIEVSFSRFCCAVAQQNYVAIHILNENNAVQEVLLRTTLADVLSQLPGAVQVHRSYIINPEKINNVTGSKRKAKVLLENAETPIPVGATYFDKLMERLQVRP
ncbi:LytTR family transcriptional regulator DNA-binding domain-containing protein [Alteromonas sp. CYL-A6]|uniref:LytTR family transcriptional regulator DNA-binding domain-containing protein n=1 Tax=Alteromonas nitratireducens TaxID=3390813 RepID=UPI0034B11A81